MKNSCEKSLVWGLGLSDEDARTISLSLGPDYAMKNWPANELPDSGKIEGHIPFVIFISLSTWKNIPGSQKSFYSSTEGIQTALILDSSISFTNEDIVSLYSSGFLSVMTSPCSPEKVLETLEQALESRDLFQDIVSMTQEISLERELLARKNDQLVFLSRLLARASESLNIQTILRNSREDLATLLKVDELCAVVWKPFDGKRLEADLHIPAQGPRELQESWIEYLLAGATRLSGKSVSCYHINYCSRGKTQKKAAHPDPGKTLLLPLGEEDKQFGFLALVSQEVSTLGRDRLQTLRSAVQHLALALNNAVRYRNIKDLADHDGLTRIHNRQHFDKTFLLELKRHQRQNETLSILMLDLDYFKSINDTYGHQAGDMVLQEMGRLLTSTARETDYTARYGGEEFVALLPHTSEDQAWILAERIRKRLAEHSFEFEGKVFQVTTSIGIASVKPKSLQPASELISQADKALYRAKAAGRNMVCLSAETSKMSSVICHAK